MFNYNILYKATAHIMKGNQYPAFTISISK